MRRAVSRNDSFHASVSFKILPKTECSAFVVDALRDWLSFKHSSKSNYTKAEYYKCVKACVATFDLEELLTQETFMKRYSEFDDSWKISTIFTDLSNNYF